MASSDYQEAPDTTAAPMEYEGGQTAAPVAQQKKAKAAAKSKSLTQEQEFEFRARAELEMQQLQQQQEPPAEEPQAVRRTPMQMKQEYTSQFTPLKRTPEGYDLAVPGIIQGIGQAITAPGRALQSGGGGDYMEEQSPFQAREEAFNFALNLIGGGARGLLKAGKPGLRMERIEPTAERLPSETPGGPTEPGMVSLRDVSLGARNEPEIGLGQARRASDIAGGKAEPPLGTLGEAGARPDLGLKLPEGMGTMPLSDVGKPGFMRSVIERAKERAAATESRASTFDESIARGKAEGLVTYPDNLTGKAALLLGGKTKMKAAVRDTNLEQYDRMAREESGLGPNEPINKATLVSARTRLAQPYRDLEKISPAAGKLWKQVQSLRIDSRKAWDAAEKPEERDAARAIDRQIEEKENQIDKIAQMNFKPDQLGKLRSARKALAKNFLVDEAQVEGTGHIRPEVIQRALNNERPLSGKLETIAKFKNAEKYIKDVMEEETGPMHMAVGGGLGLHRVGGGLYYPGIPVLGKWSRNLALSKIGQTGRPKYQPGMAIRLADVASRNPYAWALTPGLGLHAPPEEEQ